MNSHMLCKFEKRSIKVELHHFTPISAFPQVLLISSNNLEPTSNPREKPNLTCILKAETRYLNKYL